MDELALNILDIAYNSIRAHASLIQIVINDSVQENIIDFKIIDNGDGMDEETVSKVVDPFYTTRTTRSVGLGIPMLKQNAELTGGFVKLSSWINAGTTLQARFVKNHIDTPVMGDIIETIVTLIQANQDIDYEFIYKTDESSFVMKTCEIKEILGDVPITNPEVLMWIKDYMKEGLQI